MGTRGRKRKQGVDRYACGEIKRDQRGETSADAMATALKARAKRVGAENAHKYEAGFELGKAYLRGQIKRHHLKAGEQWALDVDRYHRMMGIPSPFPKAQDWMSVKGQSGAEPSAEQIRNTANRHMLAMTALADAGRIPAHACKEVCIMETDAGAWPSHMLRALQRGLQALADLYRISEFDEEEDVGRAA